MSRRGRRSNSASAPSRVSSMNRPMASGSARAPPSCSLASSTNAGNGETTSRRSASKAVIWALQRTARPMVRTPGAREPTADRRVPRGHERRDAREVRRSGHRRGPLRHAAVGRPEHADLAVGPRLGGGPLHGVVAVLDIGDDRVEVAFGTESTAAALDDDGVSLGRDHPPEQGAYAVPGAVRVALDEHGMRTTRSGAEHIGAEPDAIPHRHHDVVLFGELGGVSHGVPSVRPRTRRPRRGSWEIRAGRRTRRSPAPDQRRPPA